MNYAINDQDGTLLTAGLPDEVDAFNVAQQLANARGESVFLYEDRPSSEVVEVEPSED